MDYQYNNTNLINNMDYWTLVNILMTQITPDTRKKVLDRLMEMNNQLLMNSISLSNIPTQPDLSRSSTLNSRKKDVKEIQHPSLDRITYKGPNPLPINAPINANNQPNPYSQISNNTMHNNIFYKQSMNMQKEIDLDDIIDEFDEPDNLDKELMKISQLHTKIITDKRRRRHNRESKK